MIIRTVTLTAVAALSFGMSAPVAMMAFAQDSSTTTTVPITSPAQAQDQGASTPETPAPAAGPAESAETAETGTAAEGMTPTDVTPTPVPGEPPAAPKEGLPAAATEETVEGGAAPEPSPSPEPSAEPAPATTEPGNPPTPGEGQGEPDNTAPEAAPTASGEAPQASPAAPAEGEALAPAGQDTPSGDHEAADAPAASHDTVTHDVAFSFEGPFGRFDQFELQRGLQVYTEVCAACHGMKQVAIRALAEPGGPDLPEDQVRAYAANLTIMDADTGEERPREPTDHFPTVSGEGMGPDLSLMAKARAGFSGPDGSGMNQLFKGMGGAEHIYSILTGYTGETKVQAGTTLYENHAFPGGWIGMPPPLADGQVTFEDGAPNDLHAESKDVSAFLMWAAEPKMMARKQAGLTAVVFLILLSVLLYLSNKRLWWPIKHPRREGNGTGAPVSVTERPHH